MDAAVSPHTYVYVAQKAPSLAFGPSSDRAAAIKCRKNNEGETSHKFYNDVFSRRKARDNTKTDAEWRLRGAPDPD